MALQNLSLSRLTNLDLFSKRSKKADLPSGAIGRVVEAPDGKSIIATVESDDIELHRHYFIQVKSTGSHLLIGQIENLTGKEVKVGVQTAEGSVSFMVSAKVTATTDVEETRVLLTARIVSFVGPSDEISMYRPTTGYIGQPVFLASPDNLMKIFSRLSNNTIIPLEIGTVVGSENGSNESVPVSFDPTGFMRHTAVFGQSGSGKSFSFGIVLEEIIKNTEARVLVFDPNSDYRRFSSVRPPDEIKKNSKRNYTDDDHRVVTETWDRLKPQFLRFAIPSNPLSPDGSKLLSLLFSDIRRANQCRLVGLDPVLDHEDYGAFCEILDNLGTQYQIAEVMAQLRRGRSESNFRLLHRIENREIDKLRVWGPESVIDHLRRENWRFAAIDLKVATSLERSIVASAILEALYRDMVIETSKVTFIVIDEAHNLCPRTPWDPHQNAPTQILHEIAAEGRKYGAFLMLLTQNPSKLSEQALIQCDNIILMNMTSSAEVRSLEAVVKDAGPGLSGTVFGLSRGEAVCMGGIVRNEVIVKFDLRKTEHGGDDVSKDWAKRKI
jgi:DNA helicase HerA-like ATPase